MLSTDLFEEPSSAAHEWFVRQSGTHLYQVDRAGRPAGIQHELKRSGHEDFFGWVRWRVADHPLEETFYCLQQRGLPVLQPLKENELILADGFKEALCEALIPRRPRDLRVKILQHLLDSAQHGKVTLPEQSQDYAVSINVEDTIKRESLLHFGASALCLSARRADPCGSFSGVEIVIRPGRDQANLDSLPVRILDNPAAFKHGQHLGFCAF